MGLTSWTGICMYRHPRAAFASSRVLTLDTLVDARKRRQRITRERQTRDRRAHSLGEAALDLGDGWNAPSVRERVPSIQE